jgi:Domain of unknown function (DUF4124)/Trypsin-like peptidase domain
VLQLDSLNMLGAWCRSSSLSLLVLLALMPILVTAGEVYKWTDANGRLHFSDKPPPSNDKSAQKNVAQIRLGAAGPSFNLRRLTPISDSGGASRVPLNMANLTHTLLAPGRADVTTGQYFTGVGCGGEASPLILSILDLDFTQPRFQNLAIEGFTAAGWDIKPTDASTAGMQLRGEVVALRADSCAAPEGQTTGGGARAYVRMRWVLSGPAGESLYRGSSEGAHDGWNTGITHSVAIDNALAMAANNLLADQGFVDKVREQRFSGSAVSASGAATEASVRWGDSTGMFPQRTGEIQGATLMVQARGVTGSGIIIDLSGWAITSARLVGTQPNVMVLVGKLSLPAAVVKRDELSDVALLRLVRNEFTSVLIAPNPVLPGDAVQIVTAPSTAGAVNTITRSSITAEEKAQGKQRFQLATTEVYSNAGAPVFNGYGELAGLVTMDPVHAGKGVEGLRIVPILQALNALGIDLR